MISWFPITIKFLIKVACYLAALCFFIVGFGASFNECMNDNPASELTSRQLILILMWLVGAYILTNFLKDWSLLGKEEEEEKK